MEAKLQQISWCVIQKITATSRNTVGGKEVVGAILGFQTSQKALERSLLTSRKEHTQHIEQFGCVKNVLEKNLLVL